MKTPNRWLEDPGTPANVRSVLRAAGAPPAMPPHAQARLAALAAGLVAHGAALPAAAAGAAVKPALGWLGVNSAGKAVAIVSLMGVVGSGSYMVTRMVQQNSVAGPALSANAYVGPRVAPSVSAPQTSAPPAEVAEPIIAGTAAPAPTGTARPNLARSPRTPTEEQNAAVQLQPSRRGTVAFDEPSISDEARLLEQARARLSGDPVRALEIASAHENSFPAGQLSDERELIAIDALLQLGRRHEAEQRAAPRLRQAPDSIYGRRLRQLLAPKVGQ